MYTFIKIRNHFYIWFIILSCINASLNASPDTTRIESPDTVLSPAVSDSSKIDSLISKNEPPVFINKFNKFKRLFDKIITQEGDTLTVLINKVNESKIEFNYPLNHRTEILDKRLVVALVYSDGTTESFPNSTERKPEKQEPAKNSEKDWDKVLVLKSLDEASGAEDLGDIESKFEGDRITVNSAYLEKSAMILLKKKAARLGANYIYISNKDDYRAYGELPHMTITARAFSRH